MTGGIQRAAPPSGLDDDGGVRQRGDQPIALKEPPFGRGRAARDLAHHQAGRGDPIDEARVSRGIRAVDAARNVSETTTRGYVLDTTPPVAPAAEAPTVTPATRLQPGFAFPTEQGTTYECRLDGPGGYERIQYFGLDGTRIGGFYLPRRIGARLHRAHYREPVLDQQRAFVP